MNIVTIGNRCSTDSFLKKYGLRNYSGPFSFILTDLETSLYYIKNRFDKFLDVIEIDNTDFKIMHLPHWRMTNKFFVNKFIYENYILNFDRDIYDLDRLLIWNHHNPIKDRETLTRRYERILDMIDNHKNLLFLYFSKIVSLDKIDNEVNKVIDLINKYNFKNRLCYVIFVEATNNKYDSVHYKSIDNVDFLLCDTTPKDKLVYETKKQSKVGTPLLDVDINDKNINWSKLATILKNKYLL